MRLIPLIAITNHSTVLADTAITDALYAFQQAVHYDWRPAWDIPGTLTFYPKGAAIPADAWQIVVLDDSDQADALGYHDLSATGRPIASVFAKTDIDNGYSWTVTFTHELFEMLADPFISLAAQTSNTQFYAYEVGDPVEADKYCYLRNDLHGRPVKISNFVTPAWFQPGLPGPFDHCKLLSKSLQLLSGGYVSIFTSGSGWSQRTLADGKLVPVALDPNDPRFRDRSKPRA
jgi:hypothetical protein